MCKGAAQSFKIVPRAKQINGQIEHPNPVVLTIENLERHFSFPLNIAAKQLGVCETSLKWCESCSMYANGLLKGSTDQIVDLQCM